MREADRSVIRVGQPKRDSAGQSRRSIAVVALHGPIAVGRA